MRIEKWENGEMLYNIIGVTNKELKSLERVFKAEGCKVVDVKREGLGWMFPPKTLKVYNIPDTEYAYILKK